MTATSNHCQECAKPLSGQRRTKQFCGDRCRLSFNNRRTRRGAELYDLFCALRRERTEAKALNIWTQMCRLELRWHEEDDAERDGRRSYAAPGVALARLLDTGRLQRGETLASNATGARR